jgi:Arc/MetJ-type ribon-helix-helix transcriptional regulator
LQSPPKTDIINAPRRDHEEFAMTVEIPDSLRDFVQSQIAAGRYPDECAMVSALLQKERARMERGAIDKQLLGAVESSESTPMTSADWDEIRTEVQRRHAARNGSRT